MSRFKKHIKHWIGVSCLTIFTITSCVQESDVATVTPESIASMDDALAEVLDLMDTQPQLSIEKLNDIIEQAEAIDSRYYAGKAKWYKGYIQDEILEDVSQAYYSYNEALKDVLQTKDASLKMKIYNNLGILYRFYNQYDAAIRNYESALNLSDEISVEQLSDLYYNYGVALKLKGDSVSFFDAELAFTKSLELAKKVDYHKNIAIVHNQIGLMYKTLGNYDMARISYENTIRTYITDPNLREKVGRAYHGIGVTYMEEGNNEAAVRSFNKALEYKKSSGSRFITKYDLGSALMLDGHDERAIAVWKDALNEKHNKNSIEQVQIYSDLTEALKKSNRYEEAL